MFLIKVLFVLRAKLSQTFVHTPIPLGEGFQRSGTDSPYLFVPSQNKDEASSKGSLVGRKDD